MSLRWYLARTRPLAEYMARDNLATVGVQAFLPCSRTQTPRPGHRDAPLFPGYLFVRYDVEGLGWGHLSRVPQIVGPVAFGGDVPPVPDEVIEELDNRVNAIEARGGLWRRFRAGERVHVALGHIESLGRVIQETTSSQGRVRVLLEFLGRQVEAQVPGWGLSPVAEGDSVTHGHDDTVKRRPQRHTRGGGRWIKGHGPRALGLDSAT